MGKYGVENVGANLGKNVGSGVNVGGASNAASVAGSNAVADSTVDAAVDAAVDATDDTAKETTTNAVLLAVGVPMLIVVIAVLVVFFCKAYSEKQKNKCYDAMTDDNLKDLTSSESDPLVSASNAQKSTIGNILVSSKDANKELVGKLRDIVIKIKNGAKLGKEDVKNIEITDVYRIDSNIIKSRSTFGLYEEDLADATRELLEELIAFDYNQKRVDEATEKFKKKAGIKDQTSAANPPAVIPINSL